ncbi:hypothetical protein [Parasedimentitalea denitrificans]|uniref:hypothetical protein n=1 Tax=Parasedimentitalea denitrificans TaxID=2211118 RepID=UPI001431F929|nr:hypothetical protein [Sedimentitalea sp. CY04]
MTTLKKAVLRPLSTIACRLFDLPKPSTSPLRGALIVCLGLAISSGQVHASVRPYIIRDDRGGFLRDRQLEIMSLQASGQPIEIRGSVCYSTCTMFLGLPQTCISARTVFGFHGPSRSGVRLAPDEFDRYSHMISKDYPKPLRDWFMKKGRKRIDGVHRIKGTEIIRMGVRECSS